MSVTHNTEDPEYAVETTQDDWLNVKLQLSHNNLPLLPVLSDFPDLRVTLESQTVIDTDPVLFFTLDGDPEQFDAFEDELPTDPTITEARRTEIYPQRRVYRATLASNTIQYQPMIARVDGRALSQTGMQSGWELRLRLPDREALKQFNTWCSEEGVSVHVHSLCLAGTEGQRRVGLTPKQQQFLTIAYKEGYFDYPRGISQEEIADRLNVSKSAISQRSRRAIKSLCRETLPNLEASTPTEYNGV